MTPQQRARLAELRAELNPSAQQPAAQAPEQIGMMNRVGRHLANFVPSAMGAAADTLASIPNLALRAIGVESGNVGESDYRIVDVPAPQTGGETAMDVVMGGVLPELPTLIGGAGLLRGGAKLLGAGPRAATILADAGIGAMSGARQGAGEMGAQSAEFGALGAASVFARPLRPLLRAASTAAAGAGISAAGQVARGNDPFSQEGLLQMGIMGGLPLAQEAVGAAGRKMFRRAPAQEVAIDEVMTPHEGPLALPGPSRPMQDRYPRLYDRAIINHPAEMAPDTYALPGPTRPAQDRLPRLEWPHGEARTFSPSGEPIAADAASRRLMASADDLSTAQPTFDSTDAFSSVRNPKRATFDEPVIVDSPTMFEPTIERQAMAQRIMAEQERTASMTPEQKMGLRALLRRPNESGQINPMLLGGIGGAGIGALADPDSPMRGAAIGAAVGAGGMRLLRRKPTPSKRLVPPPSDDIRPTHEYVQEDVFGNVPRNKIYGKFRRLDPQGSAYVASADGRWMDFRNPYRANAGEDLEAAISNARSRGNDSVLIGEKVIPIGAAKLLPFGKEAPKGSGMYGSNRAALLADDGSLLFSDLDSTHADLFNRAIREIGDVPNLVGKGHVDSNGRYIPHEGPSRESYSRPIEEAPITPAEAGPKAPALQGNGMDVDARLIDDLVKAGMTREDAIAGLRRLSPQAAKAAPMAPSSGEPVSSGGKLRSLSSQRGAVNPQVLAPIAGASVGALTDSDDPVQGALIGAALATVGARGAKLLRSAKIREAADREMRPKESTALGKVSRFMEKNMNVGKSARLTALDDRAKGEAEMFAERMEGSLKKAGRMAYGEGLTAAQKSAGEAFILSNGDPVALANLRRAGVPAEYQNYLEAAKESQKQMQGVLMRAESDPRKQSLIASTLGTYQTRQYRYFLQGDEFKIDPADKAAVVNEWRRNPIFAGIDPAIMDDVVTKDLDLHLRELANSGADYTRLATEGKSKISQSLFKGRKDLTDSYRKLLGEVKDPHEANVLTANKLLQSVAQAKVVGDLRTAADEAGNRFVLSQAEWKDQLSAARRAGDKAKEQVLLNRYVDAPESPGIGALSGRKVQRQVADYFQFAGHEGIKSGNGSWYAQLNAVPKAVFTRLNAGTWIRNYAQAVLQGHALGIWNPTDIIKTAWRMGKDPALREQLTRSGVLGGHAGRHEFGQMAQKLGASLNTGIKGRTQAVMKMINEGYGAPDKWIRATAYLREFDRNVARGIGVEEAGLQATVFVNRYSHNYGQVSRLIGKARNIPLVNPFLSYSAEMARILKNLAEDVVTGSDRAMQSGVALTSLLAVPTMVAYAAKEYALSDGQKAELSKMEKIMPPYMRGRLNLALGADAKGNFTSGNMQPWLPAADFVGVARNILKGDVEALATQNPVMSTAGTPLLNAYTEIRTGKDLVTGEKVDTVDVLRKNVVPMDYRLRMLKKGFTPNDEGGLGISTPNGNQVTPGSAIAGLFGASTTNTSKRRLLKRVQVEHDQAVADAKKEVRQVLRTNASAEIKQAARAEFTEKKRRLLQRRKETLQAVK